MWRVLNNSFGKDLWLPEYIVRDLGKQAKVLHIEAAAQQLAKLASLVRIAGGEQQIHLMLS